MRYLMLICVEENAIEAFSPDEGDSMLAEYGAFMEDMGKRGVLQGGERLHPTTDATTVRVRDGETVASDGPFAETKEALGGFFLLEADNLDDAIAMAARIPAARMGGAVEVRPLVEM